MSTDTGKSKFIILYHRTPFDEKINKKGELTWTDQKSPNGIIPTLRNLFLNRPEGTWIAWRKITSAKDPIDERLEMSEPASFILRSILLSF